MIVASFAKLVLSNKEYLRSLAQAVAENKILWKEVAENLGRSLKRTLLENLNKLWEDWASSRKTSVMCPNKQPSKVQRLPADSNKPQLDICNVNNMFFPAASDEWKSSLSRESPNQVHDEVRIRSKKRKPGSNTLISFTQRRSKCKLSQRDRFSRRKRSRGSRCNFRKRRRYDYSSSESHYTDHLIETSSERSKDDSDKYSDVATNDTQDELNRSDLLRQCWELGIRRDRNSPQERGFNFQKKTGKEFKREEKEGFVNILVPRRSKRKYKMVKNSKNTSKSDLEAYASLDLFKCNQKLGDSDKPKSLEDQAQGLNENSNHRSFNPERSSENIKNTVETVKKPTVSLKEEQLPGGSSVLRSRSLVQSPNSIGVKNRALSLLMCQNNPSDERENLDESQESDSLNPDGSHVIDLTSSMDTKSSKLISNLTQIDLTRNNEEVGPRPSPLSIPNQRFSIKPSLNTKRHQITNIRSMRGPFLRRPMNRQQRRTTSLRTNIQSTNSSICKENMLRSSGKDFKKKEKAKNIWKKRFEIVVEMKEDNNGKAVVAGVEKQPPPQCAELLLCLDRLSRPAAFGLKCKPVKGPTVEHWLEHVPKLCNLKTKQSTFKIFSYYRKKFFDGKYARLFKEEL